MRQGEIEKFGYKAEGGDIRDMKYVLVKGEDSECRNCKKLEVEHPRMKAADGPDRSKTKDVLCYFVIGDSMIDGRRFLGVFINAEDGTEPSLLALLVVLPSEKNPYELGRFAEFRTHA